jgi:hypothetical protein
MADFAIADLSSSTAIDIVILSSSMAKHVTQEMDDWMTKRRVRIEGEELAVVEDMCRKLPIAESMRCHSPPLGLRFYRNEHLFCAFSLCWRCNNAFDEYEGQPIFFFFDGRSVEAVALFSHLQKIVGADSLHASEIQ